MTDTSPHTAAHRPSHSQLGVAGRTARAFIELPLTPLLLMAFFLIGLLGMLITPREEDPQISVPMVDVFVAYPGASSSEVANLISEPLERLMSELSGVKHVYSMSREGLAMVTVRFDVGEQMEPSLVKLYDKLYSHMDAIPKGVMQPLVKPKSIDDVPVVTVTLSPTSSTWCNCASSDSMSIKGSRRCPIPARVLSSAAAASKSASTPTCRASPRITSPSASWRMPSPRPTSACRPAMSSMAANGSTSTPAPSSATCATSKISSSPSTRTGRCSCATSPMSARANPRRKASSIIPSAWPSGAFKSSAAVTVAVAKKRGSNGIDVAAALIDELAVMKGSLIPDSVKVTVTRDYGESAHDKVSHLIIKLFIVSALVTVLAFLTMGLRPALIVAITIPAAC